MAYTDLETDEEDLTKSYKIRNFKASQGSISNKRGKNEKGPLVDDQDEDLWGRMATIQKTTINRSETKVNNRADCNRKENRAENHRDDKNGKELLSLRSKSSLRSRRETEKSIEFSNTQTKDLRVQASFSQIEADNSLLNNSGKVNQRPTSVRLFKIGQRSVSQDDTTMIEVQKTLEDEH